MVEARGIEFAATAAVVDPPYPESNWRRIDYTVTLRNPSDTVAELMLLSCPLAPVLRPDGGSTKPVWRHWRDCEDPPTTHVIVPQHSMVLDGSAALYGILSDSVPEGPYKLSVNVRFADTAIEVPAGVVILQKQLEAFDFAVELQPRRTPSDTLLWVGTITNITNSRKRVSYSQCAIQVTAYPSPEATEPVWRSARRRAYPPSSDLGYVCLDYLVVGPIAAKESINPGEYRLRVPVMELLGDSLPEGRYWFRATARLNSFRTTEFDAGHAHVAQEE